MTYREMMDFCCENDTTVTDARRGDSAEFVNVEPGGTCDNH
jgi:hypothetical protein